jgi:hypothetical protein
MKLTVSLFRNYFIIHYHHETHVLSCALLDPSCPQPGKALVLKQGTIARIHAYIRFQKGALLGVHPKRHRAEEPESRGQPSNRVQIRQKSPFFAYSDLVRTTTNTFMSREFTNGSAAKINYEE